MQRFNIFVIYSKFPGGTSIFRNSSQLSTVLQHSIRLQAVLLLLQWSVVSPIEDLSKFNYNDDIHTDDSRDWQHFHSSYGLIIIQYQCGQTFPHILCLNQNFYRFFKLKIHILSKVNSSFCRVLKHPSLLALLDCIISYNLLCR
jgi:hypothetical protein